jgi:DNA-binding CsgD family transcriptional regulator
VWIVGINTVTGNLPFRLTSGEFSVGRRKKAHIYLGESTVSRKHATLTFDGATLLVKDLGSSNGTFVNDVRVIESQLHVHDLIRFGSVPCAISPSPFFEGRGGEDASTYPIQPPRRRGDTALVGQFTDAQAAIIPLLMSGKSEPEIAALLDRSPHTIHTHIRAIYEKAGVHSREELIVKLMQQK